MSIPNDASQPILIESVSVVPVYYENNECWIGVTCCFSDGVYAYAFCLRDEVREILEQMCVARGLDAKEMEVPDVDPS